MSQNYVRCKRGITYLEVIVAMAILSMVLMFMVNMISVASRTQVNNEETTRLVLQAQSQMEINKAIPGSGDELQPDEYPYLRIIEVTKTSPNPGVDPFILVSYNLESLVVEP